jgi:hypothetical protein
MILGAFQRPRACAVRAVPPDLLALDPAQDRVVFGRGTQRCHDFRRVLGLKYRGSVAHCHLHLST